jgi:hypothetical protein
MTPLLAGVLAGLAVVVLVSVLAGLALVVVLQLGVWVIARRVCQQLARYSPPPPRPRPQHRRSTSNGRKTAR